jgi:signal transduction histidine kinase
MAGRNAVDVNDAEDRPSAGARGPATPASSRHADWHGPVGPEGIDWSLTSDTPLPAALVDQPAPQGLRPWSRSDKFNRLESLGRLTTGVVHDFNNLLTVILGNGEMLLETLGANDPLRATLVREILNAADRGAAITSHLLAFSRKQSQGPRVMDLVEVARAMQEMLHRLLDQRIDLASVDGPARVKADPNELEQVLLNLVLFAREHRPRGGRLSLGTTLVLLTRADPILPIKARPGNYALWTISNRQPQLALEPSRYEPSLPADAEGDFGLAIVDGIVEQLGGFIQVCRATDQGTTFRVYLPQASPGA